MKDITTKQVYDLIGAVEVRLTDKIDKLYAAFMDLEAGRLSAIEKAMAEYSAEIKPVKALVYGCAGIILTAVIVSIVYLVIKR